MTEFTESDTRNEMETVTSPDGTEIAYKRTGSGPPLVLVHGADVDHRFWDVSGVRESLAEHHTVYAMDCRGHGESEYLGEFELEQEFEDIVAVVDSVDEPVHLVGESGGAFFSLEAALRTDNVRTLTLHEPPVPGFEDARAREGFETMVAMLDEGNRDRALSTFLEGPAGVTLEEVEQLRNHPIWPEYVETFIETVIPKIEAEAEADYQFDPDRFAQLTVPTLLLAASETAEWLLDATNAVADALPNARVVSIDGYGHGAVASAPDWFTSEVLGFVRESN
ncbi:alpha/beta fold hydrolase [Natronorubrum sp. JWXQ-INN-674]|uniref:Alpha/beta fold hydrolase n=1 Tax=Natronorubrum halalkaliphilum TaxID=2691917 RepID=A0A6B0VMA8_9EURY|nr:alpha/beta hydrolase [Natronorubrum halalkaliphilum]MXV61882.1 alpha/beta fold hydrolase [Natronorubrum halalkaliphilum]